MVGPKVKSLSGERKWDRGREGGKNTVACQIKRRQNRKEGRKEGRQRREGAKRITLHITGSSSHLRTMLPESSSQPLPAKQPNHATLSLFDSKSLYTDLPSSH